MLLQLRRHDGTTEDIEVLRSGFAREIAASFDWDAERRRFEHLEESGADSYLPGIAFMDNVGRTLEFGPNSDDTFWVSYRYSTMKSTFGFCPIDYQHDQQLQACQFEMALRLLDQHYAGEHQDIISFLPAEHCPKHEKD
jgi:hypothetical protein